AASNLFATTISLRRLPTRHADTQSTLVKRPHPPSGGRDGPGDSWPFEFHIFWRWYLLTSHCGPPLPLCIGDPCRQITLLRCLRQLPLCATSREDNRLGSRIALQPASRAARNVLFRTSKHDRRARACLQLPLPTLQIRKPNTSPLSHGSE